MRLLPLLLLLALPAGPAAAETLVVSLSTKRIEITSNFTGGFISLYGVIERDAQTVARGGQYQLVVAVRGPEQDILVQRKQRRFGIWVNSSGERFDRMPSYYGLFATPGAAPLVTSRDGPARALSLTMVGADDPAREELRAAIALQRLVAGLFVERYTSVEMLTDTFFRTEIPLPSLAADGDYEVYVLLFAGGVPLDTDEQTFTVVKVGLEQRLFEFSQNRPLLYGLLTVALAVVTGYLGGILFRR